MRDFNHTLSVLVKAYFDGTLEHCNCSACAVGNIVADAKRVKPVLSKNIPENGDFIFSDGTKPYWQNVFCTVAFTQKRWPFSYKDKAKEQIDSTGYTWEELARIEAAFERASDRFNMAQQTDEYKDSLMFKGLMNVVEVLAEIHNIDLQQKEEAKALFVKH